MKLHLPKMLLIAVLAAVCYTPAWGAEWGNGNTYSVVSSATAIDSLTTAPTTDGAFIRAGGDAVEATITTLTHASTEKLVISGTWGNATGVDGGQGYDLKNLTIGSLNIGTETAGAALEIGTSMQTSKDGNSYTPEMQYVTINTISGTVTSLTVGSYGSLTLGSAITANAISIAEGGSLNIGATNNLTDIIKNTTGTGTINVTSNAQIGTDTDATTTSSFAGTISVQSGTLYFGDANGHNNLPKVQLSSATVELAGGKMEIFGSTSSLGKISAIVDSELGLFEVKDSNGPADLNVGEISVAKDKTLTITKGSRGDAAWHARVNVGALAGEGNLVIQTQQPSRRTYNISTVGTAEKAFGNITNKETMNLGANASSLLNMGDVTNTGTLSIVGQLAGTSNISGGTINVKDGTSVTGNITFGSAVTLEGALSNSGTLTFSTSVDLSNGLTNTGTVNIGAGYSAAGTLTNAGRFNLTGDVTVSNVTNLEDTGTVTYSGGEDGYVTSATYYVVKSEETTDSVTLTGTSSLYQGSSVIGAITTSGNNLVVTIDNKDAASGLYYVRTKDLEVNGAVDNVAVNATGYDVAAGRTLTITANQSNTMTASKILAETTGAGNITLSRGDAETLSVALDDVSTKAKGTLTITEGVTLAVGNGNNDTSTISSFNAVNLSGGTLDLNGAGQSIKNLTVDTAASLLSVRNYQKTHQTYTLLGLTTLNADLAINPFDDEHGDVIVKELTGTKNLSISNGGWGAVVAKLEKLTNYTGKISVESEGRTTDINYVEFAKGAFTTLKDLEVTNNAYARAILGSEVTIEKLALSNGGAMYLLNSGSDRIANITSLSVTDTATIGTNRSSDCHNGTINIKSLSNTGDSATLTLKNGSQTDTETVYNLSGTSSMTGTINVQSDAYRGSTNMNDAERSRQLQVNLNSKEVAAKAVINFQDATTLGDGTGDGNTNNVASNYNILGVGVDGAKVAGLTGETTNAATVKSTEGNRTLEIVGSGTYTTNAKVESNVKLLMSGSGTQNFSGDMSAFNGTVEVSGGTLGFTKADGSVTVSSLTLSGGTLNVTNSLTLNNVIIDLTQYTAGVNIDDLVAAGTLISGENYSVSYVGGVTTVGNYTGTVEKIDNSLVLTWSDLTPEKTSLTTTISGVNGLFDSENNMLTLNIDQKDSLANVGDVTISGISDDIMKDILGLDGLPTDGMVGITLRDKDGVEFTATADQIVGFQGKDGIYYGEAGTGNVGWVYQAAYIPEPTTATLSLLALAGLAARRRRKA